ncbi:penicillin-binding protein 1C [Silanimonas lenta]|uniref:penicillin-binding protein 1C n=1 Tax=Silanimonas lenta TaxID=265429 RepID=UPI0003F77F8D|nr:penicillin-binding protein 1C [Silanimonas lenta]
MSPAARPSRWLPGRRGRATLLLLAAAAVLLLALRLCSPPPLSAGVPLSTAVLDREGRLLRLTLAADQRYRLWLPLEQFPPVLVEAVLLHEDQHFFRHPGVNPVSLLRAASSTYGGGPRIGGSTLTMQLARLRWRLDTRSVPGKLVQIARALQLEAMYSKREILEAYLNLAPYGGNVEGAGTAARLYFDKPVAALSLPEALALAVMPQAPGPRGRFVEDGRGFVTLGPGLQAARQRLYGRWAARHGEDPALRARLALPLRLRSLRHLPFAAPHFVDRVLAQQALHGPRPAELPTLLDRRLQALVERRVQLHLQREAARGIDNAAVLVVDSRDMGVVALLGSADFHDARIAGQVNGTAALRSPGSTLKPFLYALAIDQGLLHPATVLRDVPSAFGAYTPENHDGRFAGPLTATEALNRSRNIPAVTVAARLGRPDLHDLLREAGVRRLRSREHYGLALVLGGGEISAEDSARLYAMLANDGRLRPLRFRAADEAGPGSTLLSPEAAFITLDMLRRHPRPGAATASELSRWPVAWKTGTSWGFRDAWTAGVVGPYVLVVWLGHFDGRSNPALIGVETAAPLFFAIADAMRAAGYAVAPQPSRARRLARVPVCLASGDLPNAWCPQRGETWFIPGVSPIRVSTVHRPVQFDRASGRVVCGPFDPATMRREVYEFWPSDLARVFAQAGLPRRRPPPGADCAGAAEWLGSPPRITQPYRATRYRVRFDGHAQAGIPLAATTDADARRIYWFADGAFIGEAGSGQVLAWQPVRAGQIRLRVVDEHGRSDEREVVVEAE